jgi:hypothetical protein
MIVTEEWLAVHEQRIRQNRRVTALIWAVSYLGPMILLGAPYIGFRVRPDIHYARTIQIVMGLGLAAFMTAYYSLRVRRQNEALRIIEDIRKQPETLYDV